MPLSGRLISSRRSHVPHQRVLFAMLRYAKPLWRRHGSGWSSSYSYHGSGWSSSYSSPKPSFARLSPRNFFAACVCVCVCVCFVCVCLAYWRSVPQDACGVGGLLSHASATERLVCMFAHVSVRTRARKRPESADKPLLARALPDEFAFCATM